MDGGGRGLAVEGSSNSVAVQTRRGREGNYNCQSCLHKFYWIEPLAGAGQQSQHAAAQNIQNGSVSAGRQLKRGRSGAGRQAARLAGWLAKGSLFGDLRLFDYFIFCRRLYMALNWIVTNFVARYSKRFIAQPVCQLVSQSASQAQCKSRQRLPCSPGRLWSSSLCLVLDRSLSIGRPRPVATPSGFC